MNWSTWLLAMAQPLVARVLVAVGFSVVTVVGLDAVISTVKALVLQHMGAMPAMYLQLMLLAGVGDALGITFGAITTRLVLWKIAQGTRILGVNQ